MNTPTLPQPIDTAALLGEVEPMVRRICRARLGEVDGDDAAQRALLRIWRALHDNDRTIGSVWAYAAATARYEVLAAHREFHRWPTPSGELAEHLWPDPDPGPAEQVERRHDVARAAARVGALLAQLSPRQADVLRAGVLADRPTADVAAAWGITPTGVRVTQARAMAHLRELCGTRSPNPQAFNIPYTQRRSHGGGTIRRARTAPRTTLTPDHPHNDHHNDRHDDSHHDDSHHDDSHHDDSHHDDGHHDDGRHELRVGA
jgi:RNA polymerase sigma factor (sigma-70 family)